MELDGKVTLLDVFRGVAVYAQEKEKNLFFK